MLAHVAASAQPSNHGWHALPNELHLYIQRAQLAGLQQMALRNAMALKVLTQVGTPCSVGFNAPSSASHLAYKPVDSQTHICRVILVT
jgi:hypothetical protein